MTCTANSSNRDRQAGEVKFCAIWRIPSLDKTLEAGWVFTQRAKSNLECALFCLAPFPRKAKGTPSVGKAECAANDALSPKIPCLCTRVFVNFPAEKACYESNRLFAL